MMKRILLSITEEMEVALEYERRKRMLASIPETARAVMADYLTGKTGVPFEIDRCPECGHKPMRKDPGDEDWKCPNCGFQGILVG